MAYLAIARKWRPQRFEDLVGQTHVVQTLKNAIRLNRVSHAYLFSGARGIGKTSVARIFAKALRCPNAQDAVPCNVCSECVAIAESRSVDVAEIDGASNNGVEAVRSIRDNVAYSAASGTYKIYIIDEVHMLTLSAFNALLKTLEEPPEHVIFMLATTEQQKIPMTILSRCQRFEFRRLSQLQIVDCLKHILSVEGVEVSEEGLRTVASHSDGSLRDAQSLLDQVLSHAGSSKGPFQDEQVVQALGVNPTSSITEFLAAILAKDQTAFLKILGDTYAAGVDLKHFGERCLEELRLIYLIVLARESNAQLNADELDLSIGHLSELQRIAKNLALLQVERMAQVLSKATSQVSWSSLPRFVLEMAAVRMSRLDGLAQIEQALTGTPVVAKSPRSAPPSRPVPPTPRAAAPEEIPAPPPAPTLTLAPQPRPAAANAWNTFVDGVMKRRPLLGALLGHAEFKMSPERQVLLSFASNSFYERQAAEARNKQDIEEMIKSFFGKDVTVVIASAAGSEPIQSIEHGKQVEAATIRKNALEHPTVVQLKEVLGAEVVDVKVEL